MAVFRKISLFQRVVASLTHLYHQGKECIRLADDCLRIYRNHLQVRSLPKGSGFHLVIKIKTIFFFQSKFSLENALHVKSLARIMTFII